MAKADNALQEYWDDSEKMKPYVNDYKMYLIEAKDNNLPLENEHNRTLFQLCWMKRKRMLKSRKPQCNMKRNIK